MYVRDPRLVTYIWQLLMMRLNTKLNMSTARYPRIDDLNELVEKRMQILLSCYRVESRSDWVSHLSLVEIISLFG